MPTYLVDRMTVSWNGKRECHLAEQFRKKVGMRKLSDTLKQLAIQYLNTHRTGAAVADASPRP